MPVDLPKLKDSTVEILKGSLGELLEDLGRSKEWLEKFGALMAENVKERLETADPARLQIVEQKFQALLGAAYAEAVRQQILKVGLAESTGKAILNAALGTAKEALTKLVPFLNF